MNINYDEMLANYNKNIETNLRDFKGGPPPFEEWCPYEGDDSKSMKHLLDLAKDAGYEVIEVRKKATDTPIPGFYTENYKSQRAWEAEKTLRLIANEYNPQIMINVCGLKKNVLTIDYEDTVGATPFHEHLIKIEDQLNRQLNETFDIQTMNIEDKNARKAYCKQK